MNAQNSDSFSPEATPPLPEVSKTPSKTTKEHQGVLDTLAGFLHKKTPEKLPQTENTAPIVVSPPVAHAPEAVVNTPVPSPNAVPVPEKSHSSITEKISHIFHKKSPHQVADKGIEISDKSPPTSPEKQKSDAPFMIDERFARLLKQDATYHSMIRSEDLKNIQLQLSMRYMLLMLAIFIVIAWIVNNRVIMFGFSDFPLLARTRDALFALLTGLFSLTVWFGSAVWFRHPVGTMILRILAGVLFFVVLVSIYLPFWG